MITDKESNQADKYIRKELTDAEVVLFQKEMAAKPDLQKHVALLADIQWTVTQIGKEKDRQLIQSFEASYQRKTRRQWILGIAASISLLIGSFLFLYPTPQKSANQIFANLYKEVPLSTGQIRGANEAETSTLSLGLFYLNNGKTKEAEGVLSGLVANAPERMDYNYYYILALFRNEKYALAYQGIEKYKPAWEDSEFANRINYYSAGCLLQLKRYEEALEKYQLVVKDEHSSLSTLIESQKVIEQLRACCISSPAPQ